MEEKIMTDREKLEKVYEFVKVREDLFYKPIEEEKYKVGSMEHMQCVFKAYAFQQVRYLLEDFRALSYSPQ